MPVHKIPDLGAGKGVLVQHVPHEGPQARGGACTQPDRAAGENLVSKPENENEETKQGPAQQGLEDLTVTHIRTH